ncbi:MULTISPECIES: diaminopimelate epimerase [unclassified Neisseria]|uniref:diaminopimelate epimerase n=1 Tax=unclassified Neisseria TaxID=2623750 RepID=UPI001072D8C3|nr:MULTISPECIES: diaminopimelate epimerase [unclassified Neisseria]MBF0804261.1 diaminopimelate epimerase [Neisseria sp. 19428wB4_WF04]TFU43004.1 diaminopimelate epimerase [Neisseria sp. WF04]
MKTLRFTKMHGLGNDFMVIDGISQQFEPEKAPLTKWANRHTGVGFDQLLLVERAHSDAVDFRYRIFNADGSEVEQCGNGARCFVRFVIDKGLTDKQEIVVETARGIILPRLAENGLVTVNMGKPHFMPSEIPFVPAAGEAADALVHMILVGLESVPVSCVSMGNPHAVIVVDSVKTAPVEQWGEAIEPHEQFPERVNVGFMEVVDSSHIRLRVYERGAGETQACGTGACAAVVAGVRLGLLEEGRQVRVSLPGGDLYISWHNGSDVMMTGPVETVFEGELQY